MREAVALAAIIAAGYTETPLTVHTRTGLAAGLTPAEIGEILTETAAFAGFPRAVTAATRLPELFADAGSPIPPDPAPRELLLDLLADPDAPTARLLADGNTTQVLTTGPATAVALIRNPEGTLVATVQATFDGHTVTTLDILTA